jgi:predicted DNA-binding transcriptional regulator YafY
VRADRLFRLVLLLQARGRMTASSLACELGVSVRTVYRDLTALSAAGVPVYAESGPGGGCQLLDGYRFPLRALSRDEAEALLIMGVPGALRELGLAGAVSSAHRQIRVTAGLDAGAGSARPALVHLDMPRWFQDREQVPFLRTLAEALRQGRCLEVGYRGDSGAEVLRTVAPLGLVNKAGAWYLAATTSSGRTVVFRAGRITAARVLAEPVRRPAGFDLADYWERWSQEFAASRPRLHVVLRASPDALRAFGEVFGEAVNDAVSAAGPPDDSGWRQLTLTFEHARAAAHRLAGFGAQVQVVSPPAVREQLLAAARGILDSYGS